MILTVEGTYCPSTGELYDFDMRKYVLSIIWELNDFDMRRHVQPINWGALRF